MLGSFSGDIRSNDGGQGSQELCSDTFEGSNNPNSLDQAIPYHLLVTLIHLKAVTLCLAGNPVIFYQVLEENCGCLLDCLVSLWCNDELKKVWCKGVDQGGLLETGLGSLANGGGWVEGGCKEGVHVTDHDLGLNKKSDVLEENLGAGGEEEWVIYNQPCKKKFRK